MTKPSDAGAVTWPGISRAIGIALPLLAAAGALYVLHDQFGRHEALGAHPQADERIDAIESFVNVQDLRWEHEDENWTEQRAANAAILEALRER